MYDIYPAIVPIDGIKTEKPFDSFKNVVVIVSNIIANIKSSRLCLWIDYVFIGTLQVIQPAYYVNICNLY